MVGYIADATHRRATCACASTPVTTTTCRTVRSSSTRSAAATARRRPGPGAPGAGDLATNLNFQQLVFDVQYAAHASHRRVRVDSACASFSRRASSARRSNRRCRTHLRASRVSATSAPASRRRSSRPTTATLTAQVQVYFDSGDAKKGLGTDHASIETALLFHQTLSDRVAIESQFGDWHPIGGSTAPAARLRGRRAVLRHWSQLRTRQHRPPDVCAGRRAGGLARARRAATGLRGTWAPRTARTS